MLIEISLGNKFCLKLTIFNFWIKLTQKRYFRTTKNENYHRILHIHINLDSKFQRQQFEFRNKFPKKKVYFRSKSEKNEHHYRILHIQISLSTNFQRKLTVTIFGPNLPTKGSYFHFKTDKIDTTIGFSYSN